MTVTRTGYDIEGWGRGELWLEGGVLVWLELPRDEPQQQPHPGGEVRPTTHRQHAKNPVTDVKRDRADSVTIARLVDRLRRYFAGRRVSFAGVAIDLGWCTPFQLSVARALRAVPYGEVVTYGELAALAGHPNAQRAAGTFCAHNRVPLVLPCHRVVAADGIGSYGSLGTGFKRRLLSLEGVEL